MKLNRFDYVRPSRLEKACNVLSLHEVDGCVIAGGTNVLSKMKREIILPRYLIDLMNLKELKYISFDHKEGLKIGGTTLLSETAQSPLVKEHFPVLSLAAQGVGSTQIRNMGTVGGNLCLDTMCHYYDQSKIWRKSRPPCVKGGGTVCHVLGRESKECYATYRADLATALISLKSKVRLVNAAGERVLPLEDLFTHRGISPLATKRDEILREVIVPLPRSNQYGTFIKLSHRGGLDYGLITVALWMEMDGMARATDVRLVYGSMGPAPLRAIETEDFLKGKNLEEKAIAREAAKKVDQIARPVKNIARGSPRYRGRMMESLAERGISQIVGQYHRRTGR